METVYEVVLMPNVEKLSVALTPELANMVRDAVSSGQYASTSEVIREALRDWRYQHDERTRRLEEIRALWDAGIESGTSPIRDLAELKREARRRLGH